MQDMDGVTATQEILSYPHYHPIIIAVTANAMKGDKERYLEAGMNFYLSKPLKADEIRDFLLRHAASLDHS